MFNFAKDINNITLKNIIIKDYFKPKKFLKFI
jgi:hypothetical protein